MLPLFDVHIRLGEIIFNKGRNVAMQQLIIAMAGSATDQKAASFHIYYTLSPGFTLPDFSAGLQRNRRRGWETRADGSGIIVRSSILAHSGEMVRLALPGSGADRLPASAMDTSQDTLIKRPIVGPSTVILRCCAAMITVVVR